MEGSVLYRITIALLLFIISIVTLAGNSITVIAVKKENSLRSKTNYLVVSLACADLMVGLFVAPVAGVLHLLDGEWIFGYWSCHVFCALDVLASTASILNLTAISLDRFVAVNKAMDYPLLVTHRRCLAIIAIVWILSALISFPAIAIWHFSLAKIDPHVCHFTENRIYRILSSLISFYLPFSFMTFAYVNIYVKARKQLKVLKSGTLVVKPNSLADTVGGAASNRHCSLRVHRGGVKRSFVTEPPSSNPKQSLPSKDDKRMSNGHSLRVQGSQNCRIGNILREHKATKTVGIVFGVFILCWLPFFTFNVLQSVINKPFAGDEIVFEWFTLLGYANSSLNPFIYAATNRKFRAAFLKILKLRRKQPSPYN